ncbi:MAG: hypothetical protein JO249_04360 [Acidobacteria bacterium]|nr:hypothetical protein [Acidobacteriota bacterium]
MPALALQYQQRRPETGILRGHYACHGLPHGSAVNGLREEVRRVWLTA